MFQSYEISDAFEYQYSFLNYMNAINTTIIS